MKLNYKRTIFVGFAFFLISAFWQAYDTIVPLILTNRFGMEQTWSGLIMALDNIFAVVMLPLFGSLSDRTNTPYGRRTPYIFFGTLGAALFFALLGQATSLTLFILLLLLSLISMATFRSPAVALMPDVTPKPLRSKGNAVINLMGTAGGIIVLLFASLFHTSEPGKTDFSAYIFAVVGVMIGGLLVFLLTVREPAFVADMQKQSEGVEDAEEEEREATGGKLSRPQQISLLLILASVALWYIGYNAVISKYSVYATNILQVSYSDTLLLAQAAAVVSYIPVGLLASRVGRRRTILLGVAMLVAAFGGAAFVGEGTPPLVMYFLFALAGVAWATINVNSFPMVVELASGGDVGRYTGYYYTASMAAQIVTPVLSGFLMDQFGMRSVLFPYAAVFCALSFLTMFFVRHGDARPTPKTGIEALHPED